MKIREHYDTQKRLYLEKCARCGLCAKGCPILPFTEMRDVPSREIQKGVYDFVNRGIAGSRAHTKAFACMECFKCTAGMCPEGLNPMMVNEMVKNEYVSRGLADETACDASRSDSAHRVLSSIQTSVEEYARITSEDGKERASHVFFPGCNVYLQPEKILNALDIMDALGDDWTFLPGLDHCCGDAFFFSGNIDEGIEKAEELAASLGRFQPETVVFWCPTCQCRFDMIFPQSADLPFKTMSFARYLAENLDKLPLSTSAAGTATLHEPCKSAYTGADPDAAREVLRRLPGVRLEEMERHGRDTVCCGSGAVAWFPESFDRVRRDRLREAGRTGADMLVTVCHYCQQAFVAGKARRNFDVVNYVNLVAEAMGIRREDRFKKYTLWADPEKILADASDRVAESPFEKQRIAEVLEEVFAKKPESQ